MEGLLFPIVMLTVTLVGGGIFLLVLKHQKPKHQSSEESAAIRTAQELSLIHIFQYYGQPHGGRQAEDYRPL